MAIVERRQVDGVWLAYDDKLGKWIPADKEAQEGSFLGNVARSAYEEGGRLDLGLREMLGVDVKDERARSDRALAAREVAAPGAQTLGGIAPELLAGLATGGLTAGAGLGSMLAAEAAAGGGLGFVRPGTLQERIENAAIGAGLNVAGTAAGRGIMKALQLGTNMGTRTSTRVARGIDEAQRLGDERSAAQTLQQGLDQADEAAGLTPPGARSVDEAAQPLPGGRSVGAQQTPDELLDEQTRAMNRSIGDETASQVQIREAAESKGWRAPWHYGTLRGSPARLLGSMQEFSPWQEIMETTRTQSNASLLSRSMAKAIGLADDLDNEFHTLQLPDLDKALNEQTLAYEGLRDALPQIPAREIASELSGLQSKNVLLDGSKAEKILNGVVERAEKAAGKPIPARDYLELRQVLAEERAAFAKEGTKSSVDVLTRAIDKLDKLVDDQLILAAERAGSRDARMLQQSTRREYGKIRQKQNILIMLQKSKAIGNDGGVNVPSLMSQLKKSKANGGFGYSGPHEGSAQRDLWDIAAAESGSGTGVPATGVRNIAAQVRPVVNLASGGAVAGGAFSGLSGLFD